LALPSGNGRWDTAVGWYIFSNKLMLEGQIMSKSFVAMQMYGDDHYTEKIADTIIRGCQAKLIF